MIYSTKFFRKTILTSFILAGLTFGNVSVASATGCGSLGSVTTDIWKKHGDLINTTNKYTKIAEGLVSFWNSKVGSTWAGIGPRPLLDSWSSGNVIGTTGRVFIQQAPLQSGSVTKG